MGGDHGLKSVLPAALASIKAHPELHLILVGDESQINEDLKQLNGLKHLGKSLSIVHAPEQVEMDELPSHALRNKKNSSMRIAINLVKDKKAAACVSAGNTGALMATAKFVLKTLPGIDRPAIISEMPTTKGKTRMLDLGANVDSSAEHLFQFAIMGSVLVQAVDNIEKPSVGLLNIGVEEIKGNDQVKQTAHLLSAAQDINYVGYVEGDDIFKGTVNVIVCDGFVGNVAIKAGEGMARLMIHFIKEAYKKNFLIRCISLLSLPVLQILKKSLDPSQYNGASFLGLNGIVIKSHGSANEFAFQQAIERALNESRNNVPHLIRERVSSLLKQG